MFDYPYAQPSWNWARMAGKNLLRKAVGMMLRETRLPYREMNMVTIPLDSHN